MKHEKGYSLVEMLVSMAIMTVVTGAIFQLVNPSQSTAQIQPELQDMQQRMRVGVDSLFKNIMMAGAGPYQGATTGSLMGFFAPVIPRKTGYLTPDAPHSAYTDRITMTFVPNSYSQTTIANAMPPSSEELKVDTNPGCPGGISDPNCGFKENDQVIIFDNTGNFDTFTITNVQDDASHLQHRGQNWTHQYELGSVITQVESHMFYRDTTTNQLMHYDGGTSPAVPVVDNVVGLQFDYYGDPSPPVSPKPPPGQGNCLYDNLGNYTASGMTTLTTGGGSLAPLPVSMFTDGPWCGSGSNEFDADLFRVRKIKVTLRIQTPLATLRGANSTLFANPGTSKSGQKFIPDLVTSFEIAPRNMNLTR
jgi:prepilin-type N-terminal cleavage/methylation domain-containing protein